MQVRPASRTLRRVHVVAATQPFSLWERNTLLCPPLAGDPWRALTSSCSSSFPCTCPQVLVVHLALRFLSFAPKAAVLIHNTIQRHLVQRRTLPQQLQQQQQYPNSPDPGGSTPADGISNPAPPAHRSPQLQLQAAPAWAVALRESWVLGCEWLEMAVLTLPLALGLLAPPPSLLSRMRGVWLEVLMDGVQRVAFDQVRGVV